MPRIKSTPHRGTYANTNKSFNWNAKEYAHHIRRAAAESERDLAELKYLHSQLRLQQRQQQPRQKLPTDVMNYMHEYVAPYRAKAPERHAAKNYLTAAGNHAKNMEDARIYCKQPKYSQFQRDLPGWPWMHPDHNRPWSAAQYYKPAKITHYTRQARVIKNAWRNHRQKQLDREAVDNHILNPTRSIDLTGDILDLTGDIHQTYKRRNTIDLTGDVPQKYARTNEQDNDFVWQNQPSDFDFEDD